MNLRTGILTAVVVACMGGSFAVALSPNDEVVELLSGITYTPNRSSLDNVLGTAAVEDLINIAEDTSEEADTGLRIRAYRALGEYATSDNKEAAIVALVSGLAQYETGSGEELLFVKASLLSLAQLAGPDSVETLSGFLDHPSRDVQSACAYALGITGSEQAHAVLSDALAVLRNQEEPSAQVLDALDKAIAKLNGVLD